MCVSGSLIRSSTWRSSSVSAPCISSSICLPSSAERSRTRRGSFCQALPIGCMRVFMTPSCNSAVTCDSRCSGSLNSVSVCRRASSISWLRVSTSSDTMVIRCSSVSTLTRIDWLAILASAALGDVTGRLLQTGFAGAGPGRFAKRPIEFVERRLARLQRPLQHLIDQRARGLRRRRRRRPAPSHRVELADQIVVGSVRLALLLFERVENVLDAVEGRKDQRDRVLRDRQAVAEFAHQDLGGMRERREPRQSEKAAGALDGVNETENVGENFGVVRLLLETHEFDIDRIETLMGLGQEIAQQLVHCAIGPSRQGSPSVAPIDNGSVLVTV